jgi:hypothetical protein
VVLPVHGDPLSDVDGIGVLDDLGQHPEALVQVHVRHHVRRAGPEERMTVLADHRVRVDGAEPGRLLPLQDPPGGGPPWEEHDVAADRVELVEQAMVLGRLPERLAVRLGELRQWPGR